MPSCFVSTYVLLAADVLPSSVIISSGGSTEYLRVQIGHTMPMSSLEDSRVPWHVVRSLHEQDLGHHVNENLLNPRRHAVGARRSKKVQQLRHFSS